MDMRFIEFAMTLIVIKILNKGSRIENQII